MKILVFKDMVLFMVRLVVLIVVSFWLNGLISMFWLRYSVLYYVFYIGDFLVFVMLKVIFNGWLLWVCIFEFFSEFCRFGNSFFVIIMGVRIVGVIVGSVILGWVILGCVMLGCVLLIVLIIFGYGVKGLWMLVKLWMKVEEWNLCGIEMLIVFL